MSTFPLMASLGDPKSLEALRFINKNTHPHLNLVTRFLSEAGMRASLVGYGVVTPSGTPIVTRLYAARVPVPRRCPAMLKKNTSGVWTVSDDKTGVVDYTGTFPGLLCKPGEKFINIVSTIPAGSTAPIHEYRVWLPDYMQWSARHTILNGLAGILPVNQGSDVTEAQDRQATIIHQALYSAGFVVSSMYQRDFAQALPPGFPATSAEDIVQNGPEAHVASLEAWGQQLSRQMNIPMEEKRAQLNTFYHDVTRILADLRQRREEQAKQRASGPSPAPQNKAVAAPSVQAEEAPVDEDADIPSIHEATV